MISKHTDKTIININKYNFMGRFTDLAHTHREILGMKLKFPETGIAEKALRLMKRIL